MASSSCQLFICVVCFIFMAEAVNSHFISFEALQANNQSYAAPAPHGRSLIGIFNILPLGRAKKPCRMDFNTVNYLPLRKRCRPPYPVAQCCHGLKKVACNHADQVNDVSTKCAQDMFRNVQKWYPVGWFVNHCNEGQHGLICPRNRRN